MKIEFWAARKGENEPFKMFYRDPAETPEVECGALKGELPGHPDGSFDHPLFDLLSEILKPDQQVCITCEISEPVPVKSEAVNNG